jgi:hypothetical protein
MGVHLPREYTLSDSAICVAFARLFEVDDERDKHTRPEIESERATTRIGEIPQRSKEDVGERG